MQTALTVTNGADLITFDETKVGLIKRTIAKGATDDELSLFLHQCQRTGLDPLARQIYFQKYTMRSGESRMTIITGIDGYRLIADRTGKYAGSDEPVYDGRVNGYPAKATVTVYKIVGGTRVPFSSSAYWDEYYPGDKKGHMWRKMPHVMLAKVAESAALRKAFPADLSGMYTREEMDRAGWTDLPATVDDDGDVIDVTPGREDERQYLSEMADAAAIPSFDNLTRDPRGSASPQAQEQRERPAANGDSEVIVLLHESPTLRKQFHATGTEAYGPDWDEKRAEFSAHYGVNTSNDLTVTQARKIIAGMNERLEVAE